MDGGLSVQKIFSVFPICIERVFFSAGVQRVTERIQDLHKHGVREERRPVHVPAK